MLADGKNAVQVSDGFQVSDAQATDLNESTVQVSDEDNSTLPKSAPPQTDPLPSEEDKGKETALAGPDGRQLEGLIGQAKLEAQNRLAGILERIVRRVLTDKNPEGAAFTMNLLPQELSDWADLTATLQATGELLGRSSVREKAKQAGPARFSDQPTTFTSFADPIPLPDSPERAVAYFRKLVPTLGESQRFIAGKERTAFTMAYASNQKMLRHIQKIILDELETGSSEAGPTVQQVLKRAGVHPANPQYAEMVVRTNLNDAYTQGVTDELKEEGMQEVFPVWKYVGIDDGRQGPDHAPHFGRYYSSSTSFAEVRGDRPFNCRCVPIPVDAEEWSSLSKNGARLSSI